MIRTFDRTNAPGDRRGLAALFIALVATISPACHPTSGTAPSGPTVTSATLADLKLTQNGLVTRPIAPMPLVAGKTTLLRGTVQLSDSTAVVEEATARIVRESDGSLAGSVRGYAIATDDRTLVDWIRHGEHVHFFIPGRLFAEGGSFRIETTLRVRGQSFTQTALTGVTARENPGISLVITTFDEGIFRNLSAFLRFVAHLEHTGRIFPVKNSQGELLPLGTSWRGAEGVRYEYFGELPIAAQGDLGDFTNEFLLQNMRVGNTFQPGKFLAFNFTFSEDLNSDGDFSDPNEQGAAAPQQTRVSNFGNFFIDQMEAQKRVIRNVMQRETPVYRMTFVTAGGLTDTQAQNRTGWFGNAIGWTSMWLAGDEPAVFQQELAHEMGINMHTQDRGLPNTLPGPGYDLLLRRRVQTPKNVMDGGGSTPLRDSFLSDQDFDQLVGALVARAAADNTARSAGDGRTHVHVHGIVSAKDEILGSLAIRTEPSSFPPIEKSSGMSIALADAYGRVLARQPAEVSKSLDSHGGVWEDQLEFRGRIPADPIAAWLLVEKDGLVLRKVRVSSKSPALALLSGVPDFWAPEVALAWKASDPDGDALSYDVSLVYADGRVHGLAAGIHSTSLSIPTSRIPGGKAMLRIEASDGFRATRVEVPGLVIPNHAPRIVLVDTPTTISLAYWGTASLRVRVSDADEGRIADDRIEWRSDRDGFLGNGPELLAHLSQGTHAVTVQAVDREGALAQESITIVVK